MSEIDCASNPRKPLVEAIAFDRCQAAVVEGQLFLQPGVPCDKRTLRRLFGTPDEIRRKELRHGGGKFSLWIRLSFRRHEEARLILLTLVAPKQIGTIMQQEMPFALIRQPGLAGQLDEFLQVGRGGFSRPAEVVRRKAVSRATNICTIESRQKNRAPIGDRSPAIVFSVKQTQRLTACATTELLPTASFKAFTNATEEASPASTMAV